MSYILWQDEQDDVYDGKVSQHSEKAYERKVPIRQKVTSCRVRPELQNEWIVKMLTIITTLRNRIKR